MEFWAHVGEVAVLSHHRSVLAATTQARHNSFVAFWNQQKWINNLWNWFAGYLKEAPLNLLQHDRQNIAEVEYSCLYVLFAAATLRGCQRQNNRRRLHKPMGWIPCVGTSHACMAGTMLSNWQLYVCMYVGSYCPCHHPVWPYQSDSDQNTWYTIQQCNQPVTLTTV